MPKFSEYPEVNSMEAGDYFLIDTIPITPTSTSKIQKQNAIPNAAAGGANTQIQYNASGSFAGDPSLTYDGTTVRLPALTIDDSYSFPSGDGGAGFYLATDGSGTVSWTQPTEAAWGTINGSLSDQTDLVAALNAKADVSSVPSVGGSQFSLLTSDGAGNADGDSFVTYNGSQVSLNVVDSYGGLHILGRAGGEASIAIQPDTVSDGSAGQWILYTNGSNLNNQNDFAWYSSELGTSVFVLQSATGYLGVGTNNPQYNLDVSGNISASNRILINGGTNQGVTLEVNGTADLIYLSMEGTQTIDNNRNASFSTVTGEIRDSGGQVYNVKAFGAVGDGTTDDTTAIQNAINATDTATTGVVLFPAGTYLISSALTIYSGLTIRGSGINGTQIIQSSSTAHGITGSNLTFIKIEDIEITGPGQATGSMHGVYLTGTSGIHMFFLSMRNVLVKTFGSDGIYADDSVACDFVNVASKNNGGAGIYLFDGGTSSSFYSCYCYNNTGNGFRLGDMYYCAFVGCAADGNANGYKIEASQGISFVGCGAEANTSDGIQITSATTGVTIDGFYVNTPGTTAIHVTGSSLGVTISSPTAGNNVGTSTAFIKVDTGSKTTVVNLPSTAVANSFASGTTTIIDDANNSRQSTFAGKAVVPSLQLTTTPVSGDVLTSDSSGNATWQAPAAGTGTDTYTLSAGHISFSPTNATSYYIGSILGNTPSTIAGTERVYVPTTGILASASIFLFNAGVNGTSETSTYAIAVNGGSPVTISSAVTHNNTTAVFSNTSLAISVNAGDYFEVIWTTPTWVTKPTNVRSSIILDIQSPGGSSYTAGSGLTLTSSAFSLTAPVSVANGGTGSVTQNFVDYTTVKVLKPSGDATGATDSSVINSAFTSASHILLAPGQWYVSTVGLTVNDKWLQGNGTATVLNVVSTHTGITVTGPGRVTISDMAIEGGAYGIVVNGAYDSHFRDLYFANQTSGGVQINGDDALEQHWTDITMRNVGGVAFDYERTTMIYTGSLYLDRVRIVAPPSGATGGFKFNSTAGSASLNTVFMTQCVADNYYADAYYANDVAQVFVSESWFAVNSSATSGSAAMHIAGGGFQHSYNGCYTYNGLTGGVDVLISGGSTGISLGGGHVFDGAGSTIALGLSGMTSTAFNLGTYQNYCGTLTDTPTALSFGGQATSPVTFYTDGSGGTSQNVAVIDTANPTGNTKYIRNSNGSLQVVNAAFSSPIFSLSDTGALTLGQPVPVTSGGTGVIAPQGANWANTGEEVMSRLTLNSNSATLTSGLLVLTYFTALRTETIGHIECMTGNGASGGTYAGMGIFSVNSAGLLTLVAKGEQTSSPSLFSSGFQPVGGFNTKIALSASFSKVANTQYAIGALFVGSGAPNLIANSPSAGTAASNIAVSGTPVGTLSAQLSGQSTLGTIGTTTHTLASLSGSGFMPYFVLES